MDGDEHAVEARDFLAELLPPGRGDRVVARAPAGRGLAPLRSDPPLFLESLERRVERPLLDGEHIVGELLDVLGDRVAMLRLQRERLQNEHIERALEKLALGRTGHWGHPDILAGAARRQVEVLHVKCRYSTYRELASAREGVERAGVSP